MLLQTGQLLLEHSQEGNCPPESHEADATCSHKQHPEHHLYSEDMFYKVPS